MFFSAAFLFSITAYGQSHSTPLAVDVKYQVPVEVSIEALTDITNSNPLSTSFDLEISLHFDLLSSNELTSEINVVANTDKFTSVLIGKPIEESKVVTVPTPITTNTATSTPTSAIPSGIAKSDANLRFGPGTQFEQVGKVTTGEKLIIIGSNVDGDWYLLDSGKWIAAFLVDGITVSVPTLAPTRTPTSTSTPTPTRTLPPTNTPLPTPTPPPAAATCREIEQARSQLTTAQWRQFERENEEKWAVSWVGKIKSVGGKSILAGGWPINITMSSNCEVYYVAKTEDEAIRYSLEESVTLTGPIRDISVIFGSIIVYVVEESTVIDKSASSVIPGNGSTPPAISNPTVGTDVIVGSVRWKVVAAENLGTRVKSGNQFIDDLVTTGQFISVRFELENQGTDPLTYIGTKLIDRQGREFQSSSDALFFVPDNEFCVFENLNPNITRVCTEIFETASDSEDIHLKVDDLKLFGNGEDLISLGF